MILFNENVTNLINIGFVRGCELVTQIYKYRITIIGCDLMLQS